MNWKAKVFIHSVLPCLPYGSHMHYWMQRYVTKRIPRSEARFRQAIEHAKKHVDVYRQYGSRRLEDAALFEFGAGWDLPIQLLFYASGANHQVIVDLNRLIKKDLVNDAIERIHNAGLDFLTRLPARPIMDDVESELKQQYGIDYRAPCDAKNTGLSSNSIDLVTSTETLQLIPVADLDQILRECHRILNVGGVMSITIDYDDHYAFFDKRISVYNFLQYSDRTWRRYNPSAHYQNRLRHADYVSLFLRAGFEVLEENRKDGTDADLEILAQLPMDSGFRRHSLDELAVHQSHFVLLKPGT